MKNLILGKPVLIERPKVRLEHGLILAEQARKYFHLVFKKYQLPNLRQPLERKLKNAFKLINLENGITRYK